MRAPSSDPAAARALTASLRAGARELKTIPVRELTAILGAACERMLAGLDDAAVEEIAADAALSPVMAREVVRGMAPSWSAGAIDRLVRAEFPDPRVLDGFVYDPLPAGAPARRAVTAAGPALTVHIGAGTVPGVTVTSMIRALTVKSALLAKPGSGDAALTTRFVRELRRVDDRVGAAAAVRSWPGGAREWDAWERELFRRADQVVVYGGEGAIGSVRARTPAHVRLIEHPHRLGVAIVDLRDPSRTGVRAAAHAARAAVLFDQRGCVSTHLVLLIAGPRAGAGPEWCARLARELARLEAALPPLPAPPGDLSRLHQWRGRAAMRAASGRPIRIWSRDDGRWTVVLGPAADFEAVGGRTVWVAAVSDPERCVQALAELGPVLQTVGLAERDAPGERKAWAERLAALGASRVAPLEGVPFPEPDWLHDGARPLGELVRWTEVAAR